MGCFPIFTVSLRLECVYFGYFLFEKKRRENLKFLMKTVLSAQLQTHFEHLSAVKAKVIVHRAYRVQSCFVHRFFLISVDICLFAEKQESLLNELW